MTEQKEKKPSRYRNRILIMTIQFAAVGIFAVNGASAGVVDDIPNGVSDALGVSTQIAGLILSCGVLVSLALVISMSGKKPNMIASAAVMLAAIGTLTAIGWLYSWLIIVMIVVLALMFGGVMKDWVSEKSGG
jgi:uncharacterized membrane protein YeiH